MGIFWTAAYYAIYGRVLETDLKPFQFYFLSGFDKCAP